VYGLAPTSRAASELTEAGITNSQTVQRFLASELAAGPPRVLVLDESSLASIDQVHRLFHEKLRAQDRLLLAGDIRQHQPVGAGRIFEQLQMAGMTTYGLHKIMRQQDPDLLNAVREFSHGHAGRALAIFDQHGWIHEREGKVPRLRDFAENFAQSPGNTIGVDPRNESVIELNQAVRERIRRDGHVGDNGHRATILRHRQELTAEQKQYAWSYREGDVLRFPKRNRELGMHAGSYAKVESIDRDHNTLTLRADDRAFTTKPLGGITVFTEEEREFAVGDRIQFTQPMRAMRVDNRDFGDITYLDAAGNIRVRLDKRGNRQVSFNLSEIRHLDYGYVVTSYAVQGSTKDNVLVHVAADDSRNRALIDKVFGYVALSRSRQSCRIYCDSREELGNALEQLHLKPKAHSQEQIHQYRLEKQLQHTA
jgi:ATP-dependent exoDNAse (exonuclease V) alpha subunit